MPVKPPPNRFVHAGRPGRQALRRRAVEAPAAAGEDPGDVGESADREHGRKYQRQHHVERRIGDQRRAHREHQIGHGGAGDRRAHRMREGEPEQRQRDRHHFRRRAARAQIEQRVAEQVQKDRDQHFRGAGHGRAHERRMKGEQGGRRRGGDLRQAPGAEGDEPNPRQQPEQGGSQQRRRRRAFRRHHLKRRGRQERQRRIGGDNAADRDFAVAGDDGARPQRHGVVRDEARADGQARQHQHDDEGEQPDRCGGKGAGHDAGPPHQGRDMAGQAVLGLFPVERAAEELPERLVGGDRDQHPIAESGETEGNELQPAAPQRRDHGQEHEGAVAGQEIEQADEQQVLRKDEVEAAGRHRQPNEIDEPEHRVEQRRQHRAADEEHEAEKTAQARQADQLQGWRVCTSSVCM